MFINISVCSHGMLKKCTHVVLVLTHVCGIHNSCIYAVGCFSILPSSMRLDTISCMNKYSTKDGHALCYNNE